MPLRSSESGDDPAGALLESRTASRARRATPRRRAWRRSATSCPRNVLDRLARARRARPRRADGYDADDLRIVEAIARFRAGGYDEALGFTVYDTLRYREALAPLVQEEVRVLLDRLAGEVDAERAVEIIALGRASRCAS